MFNSGELNDNHRLDSFDSGKDLLDDWLRTNARRAHSQQVARVYVWTRGDLDVCAYFAICPTEVVRHDDGLGRSASGGHSRIPGYLLARLALDRSIHGHGHGGQLLLDAIGRIVAAADVAGGRLIVVDAIDDEARRFYLRFGFTVVANRPDRLVLRVSQAAASIKVTP